MKRIFIVIVSYNGGQKFIKAIKLLTAILENNSNVNLIIADNASKDDSMEQIKKTIYPFKLIQNNKNLGFAKAVNQGTKYAIQNGAEKILLLNQDAFIKDRDFKILAKSRYDIVSPVIKFKRKNKSIYDIGGKLNRHIMRSYHLEKQIKPKRTYKIDYVSGCCMLVNSSVFKESGYFDERFFLYFEDIDFCLRASMAGFNIGVELDAEVFHEFLDKKQKTVSLIYNLIRSHLIFINKWAKFPRKLVAYFYWFFISIKMVSSKTINTLYGLSHSFH